VTSAGWSSPHDSDEVAPAQSVDAVSVDAVSVGKVPAPSQDDGQGQRQADPGPAVADLGELDTLAERPLAEHADVFGRVHAQLQAALADVDGT
jgi:hypothetical protein